MWSTSYRKEGPRKAPNPNLAPSNNNNSPGTSADAKEASETSVAVSSPPLSLDPSRDQNSSAEIHGDSELDSSIHIETSEIPLPGENVVEIFSENTEKGEKGGDASKCPDDLDAKEEKDCLGERSGKMEIVVTSDVESGSQVDSSLGSCSKECLDEARVIIVNEEHKEEVEESYDTITMGSALPDSDLDGMVSVINESSTDPYISGEVEAEEVICIPEESVMVAANVSVETMDGSNPPTPVVHSPGSLQVVSSSVEFEECVETSVVVVVSAEDDDEVTGVREMLETVEVEEEVASVSGIEMLVSESQGEVQEAGNDESKEEVNEVVSLPEEECMKGAEECIMNQGTEKEGCDVGDQMCLPRAGEKQNELSHLGRNDDAVSSSLLSVEDVKDKDGKSFSIDSVDGVSLQLFEVSETLENAMSIEDEKSITNLVSHSKQDCQSNQVVIYKDGDKSELLISEELPPVSENSENTRSSVQSIPEILSIGGKLSDSLIASNFMEPMMEDSCKSITDDSEPANTILGLTSPVDEEIVKCKNAEVDETIVTKHIAEEEKKADFDDSQSVDAMEVKLEASPDSPLHEDQTLTVLHSLNQDDTIELPPDVFNIQEIGKMSVLEDDDISDRENSVIVGNIFSDVLETKINLEQDLDKTDESKEMSDKESSLMSDDLKVVGAGISKMLAITSQIEHVGSKKKISESPSHQVLCDKEEPGSSIAFKGDPPKLEERDKYDSDFDRFLDKDFRASKEKAQETIKGKSLPSDKPIMSKLGKSLGQTKSESPSLKRHGMNVKGSMSFGEKSFSNADLKSNDSCEQEPFSLFTQDLRVSQIPLLMNESQLQTLSEIFDSPHDDEPTKTLGDERDKSSDLSALCSSDYSSSRNSGFIGSASKSDSHFKSDLKDKDVNKVDEVAQIELWLSQARSEAEKAPKEDLMIEQQPNIPPTSTKNESPEVSSDLRKKDKNHSAETTESIISTSLAESDTKFGKGEFDRIRPIAEKFDDQSGQSHLFDSDHRESISNERVNKHPNTNDVNKVCRTFTISSEKEENKSEEVQSVVKKEIIMESRKEDSSTAMSSSAATSISETRGVNVPPLPPTNELPPSSIHQANIGIPGTSRASLITYRTRTEPSVSQLKPLLSAGIEIPVSSVSSVLPATMVATLVADAVSAARLPYPPARGLVTIPSSSSSSLLGDSKLAASSGVGTVGPARMSTPFHCNINQQQYAGMNSKGSGPARSDEDSSIKQIATSTVHSVVGVVSSTTVSLGSRMSVGDIPTVPDFRSSGSVQDLQFISRVSQASLPVTSHSLVENRSENSSLAQVHSISHPHKDTTPSESPVFSQNLPSSKSEGPSLVSYTQCSSSTSSLFNASSGNQTSTGSSNSVNTFNVMSSLIKQGSSPLVKVETPEIQAMKKEPVETEASTSSIRNVSTLTGNTSFKTRILTTVSSESEGMKEEKEEVRTSVTTSSKFPLPPPPRTDSQNVLLKQLLQNSVCASQHHQLGSSGLGSIGTPTLTKQTLTLTQPPQSSMGSSRPTPTTPAPSSGGPLLPVVPSLEAQLARPVPPTPSSLLPPLLLADGPPRTSAPSPTVPQRSSSQPLPIRVPVTTSTGFQVRFGPRQVVSRCAPPHSSPSPQGLVERRLSSGSPQGVINKEPQPPSVSTSVQSLRTIQVVPKVEETNVPTSINPPVHLDSLKIEVEESCNNLQSKAQQPSHSIVQQTQEQILVREDQHQQLIRQQQLPHQQHQQQELQHKQSQKKQIQMAQVQKLQQATSALSSQVPRQQVTIGQLSQAQCTAASVQMSKQLQTQQQQQQQQQLKTQQQQLQTQLQQSPLQVHQQLQTQQQLHAQQQIQTQQQVQTQQQIRTQQPPVNQQQLSSPQLLSQQQSSTQQVQAKQQSQVRQLTQHPQSTQSQQSRPASKPIPQSQAIAESVPESLEDKKLQVAPQTEGKEVTKVEVKTEEVDGLEPSIDKNSSDQAALDSKKAKRRQYQQKRRQSVGKEGSVPKKRARKASSNSEAGAQQGATKVEEDHDSFVEGVVTLLRSTLPPMAVTEPELGRNMAVCPIFGSGDLSKLGKRGYNTRTGELNGEYGRAAMTGVADHYDTRPFGPQSPLPILPQSSQQRGFYDQEFTAIKLDGDVDGRKDRSGRGGSRDRDSGTPDTIISSSSPECVIPELSIRFPGLRLIEDEESDAEEENSWAKRPVSPVIPLIAPVPIRPKPGIIPRDPSDVDKENVGVARGEMVMLKSRFGSSPPAPLKDSGNVTVTLTLSASAAEDIASVLRNLANILRVPPPSGYQIVERTTTPPSQKLGLYRTKGKDGKEGGDMAIIQSILNGATKFCRHCDVVIMNNLIKKKVSDLPFLSRDDLESGDDLYFCSTTCYIQFALTHRSSVSEEKAATIVDHLCDIVSGRPKSKPTEKRGDMQGKERTASEKGDAKGKEKEKVVIKEEIKEEEKDDEVQAMSVDVPANENASKVADEVTPSESGAVSSKEGDSEQLPEGQRKVAPSNSTTSSSTDSVPSATPPTKAQTPTHQTTPKSSEKRSRKHTGGSVGSGTEDSLSVPPPPKVWKGRRYKFWSPGVQLATKYRKPSDREMTEMLFRLGITVMPDKMPDDKRKCMFCHQIGDGVSDGPARLLNFDVDQWVHLNCALWSDEVYETVNGALMNLETALRQGLSLNCAVCRRTGATVRCFKTRCSTVYHLGCAVKDKCVFFKNKTTYCPQHVPKNEKENELTTLSVFRRVYVNRDENRQIAKVMHYHNDPANEAAFSSLVLLESNGGDGDGCESITCPPPADLDGSLLRVGSLIFLSVGQLLPHQLQAFHTPQYIYPIGYKIVRFYWSMRVPNKRCRYVCSIHESQDNRPEFRVRVQEPHHPDLHLVDSSARGVWTQVLEPLTELRNTSGTVRLFPRFVSGEDLFGLTEPAVVRVLESLPGVENLSDYRFRYGRNPLLELPPAMNPSGCARGEPRLRGAHLSKRPHYTQRTASASTATASAGLGSGTQRPLTPLGSSMSIGSSLAGEPACPYSKQFVHSKSSQYKKMKQEWRNNVYLARSKIQGLGLYAARDIERHTMVIEYIGEIIRTELAELREKQYEARNRGIYMFRLDEDRVIDATLSGGLARYINHSCNPNCAAEIVEVERDLRIIIFAKRRISRGEELAYDYKFDIEDDQHKIPCLCGAFNCKKWMN